MADTQDNQTPSNQPDPRMAMYERLDTANYGPAPTTETAPSPPQEPPAAGSTPTDNQQPPALILGKFKSQDDLVTAYRNAEAELHRAQNELARVRVTAMAPPPVPPPYVPARPLPATPQPPASPSTASQNLADKLYDDPDAFVDAIRGEVKQVVGQMLTQQQQASLTERRTEQFFMQHPDLNDKKPLMLAFMDEVIRAEPRFLMTGDVEGILNAVVGKVRLYEQGVIDAHTKTQQTQTALVQTAAVIGGPAVQSTPPGANLEPDTSMAVYSKMRRELYKKSTNEYVP